MNQLLLQIILAIVQELANPANIWVKARDFDHNNPHANIPGDSKGRRWNSYVKKHAPDPGFDFEIVKHEKANRNYYVLPQNHQALLNYLATL